LPVRARPWPIAALQRWRHEAATYRASFEHAPEAIFLYDADGLWVDANRAACQMLGYTREELVGTRIVDLIPADRVAVYLHEEESLRASMRSLTKEGLLRRKDGTFVWIEVSRRLLPDGRGHMFVRDISARKDVERERDESLRWMRAVQEQAPFGLLLVHDPQGERLELNARAQQLLEEEPRSLEDARSIMLTPEGQPIDADAWPIRRALRGDRMVNAEYLLHNAAGRIVPTALTAGPIVGPDGAVLGALVAFDDISPAKELERLRVEWSSVIAHDLRQPLGSISLGAQLLARGTDDPKLLKGFERIHAAANRLNRMVGDLMDLSRLEARRLELVRQRVDVPALVRGCVEQIAAQAEGRIFDVCVDGHVPDAHADPDRIAQVMENLLTNAVKYGKAGTRVVTGIARDSIREVAVAVTNEGRALDAEELGRIFQRFRRTESARLEGIQGVGLGLYISRSLVEAHGGHITAESTPAGVTTFRFTLPVV
jgi:PAS domain S-box-containing protein